MSAKEMTVKTRKVSIPASNSNLYTLTV